MTYEVKLTGKQLEKLWAKTQWDNPFDNYLNNDDVIWEFLYLTERCPEVLKEEFFSLTCDNDDANEILNKMDRFWRENVIDKYITHHHAKVKEEFNIWWWSQHDVSDYEDE